jgi:hypothetical protein
VSVSVMVKSVPALALVTTLRGSPEVPLPVTPDWLTPAKAVVDPRLPVAVPSWFSKSGA